MIDKIREMKSFRNILVHRYGKIDDAIVFQIVTDNSHDFNQFIEQITKIVKKTSIDN